MNCQPISRAEKIEFDRRFDWDYNDIDFCLQAAHHQRRIVFCANSIHFHLETVTRKKYATHSKPENKTYFMEKWQDRISQAPNLQRFTEMEPFHS